jgi:UDP-2-acetamido-2,6-beta-L-arabino-hexul-4-ose reductase
MKKVGITGQNGFIGYHLYQNLRLLPNEFILINFERTFFESDTILDDFVSKCDVIVHLAGLNRHSEPSIIYEHNIWLATKLIASLERTNSKPHIIVSSSTQEDNGTLYGQSKKEVRELFDRWAKKVSANFSGMIIPNVFGPFGNPYYNSVIATFCHQVSRGIETRIDVDGLLKLIYVGDLVNEIIEVIRSNRISSLLFISHTYEAKVSEIHKLITNFKEVYQNNGEVPALYSDFEFKLFNTYRCYIELKDYFPRKIKKKSDERGFFVEIARYGVPGQTSFSTTHSGITRGNHFHTRKIERFAVIKGEALIQLRRIGTEEVFEYYLSGDEPSYVDMPIWYTHNIKNIGKDDLYTIFWINEPYNPSDPDTYLENV